MKKWIFVTCALAVSALGVAAELTMQNQDFMTGTDCKLFLNPFVESELKECCAQIAVDAGQGLAQGEFAPNTFDRAVCVNIGTAIPSTLHILSDNQFLEAGLGPQLCEIARVMNEGGRLMVAAPASYGVVFTNGSVPEEAALQHIEQVLAKIGDVQDPAVITQNLSELSEVMRASFVHKDNRLQLVTNEKELHIGQQLWCKVPEGVIASVYHSEEEYLVAIKRAGLTCEEIKRPCFFGNVKYDLWQRSKHECGRSLGTAYIEHHPFTIYYAVKRA